MNAGMKKYIQQALTYEVRCRQRARTAFDANNIPDKGFIYEVTGDGSTLDGNFITVVGEYAHGGFHYYVSDAKGRPHNRIGKKRIWNSNILNKPKLKFIGQMRMKRISKHGFVWYLTGHRIIDIQLAQMGQQFDYFSFYAPPELFQQYEKLVARNKHKEAGEIAYNFTVR